jgi:glucose/arabinose dehydrogenase
VRRAAASLASSLALLGLVATPGRAQSADVHRFLRAEDPVAMAWTPDGSRLFFDEQDTGDIRVAMSDGTILPRPSAHLDVDTGGTETGLLGIAIDPAFPTEPFVDVYFSDPALGINRLVRFRADGDVADGPPEVLLDGLVTANRYHNGGDLVFGTDGMLYVTVATSGTWRRTLARSAARCCA